jgi:hypothetical protein
VVQSGNQALKDGVYLTVRVLFVLRLALIACVAAISTGQASACGCGRNFHGKNALEEAKLEANGATVIFEGTPERFELQWDVLDAKEGELIPAEDSGAKRAQWLRMLVTFRVQKAYKGELGPEIQIHTGLGGGDCGAVFAPGLTYLVFAGGPSASDLGVSMCSPGGWIGASTVATELRYLRKERPIASDLVPSRPLTPKEYAAQEGQRHRDFEEFQKQYGAATGKICGNVQAEKSKDAYLGSLSFLSTAGYSPVEHPITQVNEDGSFCSGPLGPGKYYLYFTRGSDKGLTSAVFYPGVSERNKATIIEVSAGQTQSNISFKVPVQKTYSVRGIISTNDTSGLDARSVQLVLVGLDGGPFLAAYVHPIDFQSSFPFPKVKYFNFENVLPGRYMAFVLEFGQGWYIKKEEVSVTTHMKFISLQLVQKK